jgi:DnaD/phage-associated family protein
MKAFGGFQDSETLTAIPDTFFRELLELITDAGELKVVLYAMWSIEHMDSTLRALTKQDFAAAVLGLAPDQVKSGLGQAIEHGIMLRAGHGNGTRYFLNSPRGRAAAESLAEGTLESPSQLSSGPLERPNVFRLYEENIGPLTPLIADALKDAEGTYPAEWIVESIDLAVKNNKRSWSYCQAILRRWKEEGRGKKQNRRDDQAARQRDVEEKIRKFIRG